MQTASTSSTRQRLGRRLGLRPYYTIVERSAGVLRLASRPEANRGPGQAILAGGVALLALAVVVAVSGLLAAGGGVGFAAGALGAVVGGLLSAVGYRRALGGYAVLTTSNRITADARSATVTYTQSNRVAPERSQRLPFAAIRALRLRRRPLATGWPLRRLRPVVALELLAEGEQVWIVDSAADPEELRAVAEGLGAVLGVGLEGDRVTG